MKITFICPSLEPGRDGVGDYVRRFCAELTARGHACQALAVADDHIDTPQDATLAGVGQGLRLPARDWQASRLAPARDALRAFDPDWVSLQMVCYGYEKRGLLLATPQRLAALVSGRHRHLMLHELWIGAWLAEGLKDRLVGAIQAPLLLRLARAWGALRTHTSNPVYREQLARCGIRSEELELPGNVAIVPVDPAAARVELAQRCGIAAAPGTFFAGVFGQVNPGWASRETIERLAGACRQRGRSLVVLQVGRPGVRGLPLWRAVAEEAADVARFVELGELDAAALSRLLQGLDLGIATTAWPVTGKSGTIAALLEHGVPVVVTRTGWALRAGPTPEPRPHPRLYRFDDAFLELVAADALQRTAPAVNPRPFDVFVQSLCSSA